MVSLHSYGMTIGTLLDLFIKGLDPVLFMTLPFLLMHWLTLLFTLTLGSGLSLLRLSLWNCSLQSLITCVLSKIGKTLFYGPQLIRVFSLLHQLGMLFAIEMQSRNGTKCYGFPRPSINMPSLLGLLSRISSPRWTNWMHGASLQTQRVCCVGMPLRVVTTYSSLARPLLLSGVIFFLCAVFFACQGLGWMSIYGLCIPLKGNLFVPLLKSLPGPLPSIMCGEKEMQDFMLIIIALLPKWLRKLLMMLDTGQLAL